MTSSPHVEASLPMSRNTRQWLFGLGAFAIALGAIGLYATFAFLVVEVLWYGLLVALAGLAQVLEATALKTERDGIKSRTLRVVLGILYIAAGFYVILHPTGAGLALTLVLGLLLLASGAVRAGWALVREGKRSHRFGLVLAAVSLVLGLSMLIQWPLSGLWVLGLFVSVDLIAFGLSWCWAAYQAGGTRA
jgi:uncharacterized membrane protein HdeD (DUF308 family)